MGEIPPVVFLRKLEAAIGRAITLNRPPTKDTGRYWPILLGALIGLIPSMILMLTQATVQRQQALFNHRLTLLTELSTTVHVEGNAILSKIYDVELELNRAPDRLTVEQDAELSKKIVDLERALLTWTARMSVQLNVMNGLYTAQAHVPNFVPKSDFFAFERGPRQLTGPNWKGGSLDAMKSTRLHVISILQNMQGALVDISRSLDN